MQLYIPDLILFIFSYDYLFAKGSFCYLALGPLGMMHGEYCSFKMLASKKESLG